ncbi:MAG: alpha/beta fold hydrolase [Myxococcales bacterium]|nr:alpha/beta fold hydrolase [Myxococcales bacterium]
MSEDTKWPARLKNLAELGLRGKPPVGTTPADVVHRENKWRLLRYRRKAPPKYATPVLLVPSLINRHYVLDLLPGKSLAEWLVAEGHDVFIIDWGTPGDEDRYVTFEDVADKYIGRALRKAASYGKYGKAHLLGYCLGGLLTVVHAIRYPDRVASLLTLAAPIKFGDDGLLSHWARTETFDLDALLEASGNVPWQLMQSTFQLLRPTMNLSKTVTLVDRAWNDEFLDGFFALEKWGNDAVAFPGECFREYITAHYRNDELCQGTFHFAGKNVRLEDLKVPLLAITFEHDAIVPKESSAPLVALAGSKDKAHLHLPGGHVGAVVSSAAKTRLWPKLAEFWAKRDVPEELRAQASPSLPTNGVS